MTEGRKHLGDYPNSKPAVPKTVRVFPVFRTPEHMRVSDLDGLKPSDVINSPAR